MSNPTIWPEDILPQIIKDDGTLPTSRFEVSRGIPIWDPNNIKDMRADPAYTRLVFNDAPITVDSFQDCYASVVSILNSTSSNPLQSVLSSYFVFAYNVNNRFRNGYCLAVGNVASGMQCTDPNGTCAAIQSNVPQDRSFLNIQDVVSDPPNYILFTGFASVPAINPPNGYTRRQNAENVIRCLMPLNRGDCAFNPVDDFKPSVCSLGTNDSYNEDCDDWIRSFRLNNDALSPDFDSYTNEMCTAFKNVEGSPGYNPGNHISECSCINADEYSEFQILADLDTTDNLIVGKTCWWEACSANFFDERIFWIPKATRDVPCNPNICQNIVSIYDSNIGDGADIDFAEQRVSCDLAGGSSSTGGLGNLTPTQWAIIGGAIGGVILIAIIVFLVLKYRKSSKNAKSSSSKNKT
jgi:hypothetical protein